MSGLEAGADEIRVETVRFPAGAQSVRLEGVLEGWQMVEYRLEAHAGQVLEATLQSDNEGNFFNLTAPGEQQAMFIGADRGTRFSGRLPADGEYRILVYLMRNEARRGERAGYVLSIRLGKGR